MVVTPRLLWASVHSPAGVARHHIERSTTTGVAVRHSTMTDTSAAASSGASWSTQIVSRLCAAAVYVLTSGALSARS